MKFKPMLLGGLLSLGLAQGLFAATEDELAIRTRIAERFPGVSAENVRPAPFPGLYEVMVGPVVVYASADGRYLVKGEIFDLEKDTNLTEQRVRQARSRVLSELDDKDLVIFGNDDARHTVTVFTDVSCAYCREMHQQIEGYMTRGIQVRYAAFPRNGMASGVWQTMERVWCAPDRGKALTLAKQDRKFESKQCDAGQVTEQWQLGRMLGVRGTPAIFTESGDMIPGYLPPARLLQRLESGE